MQSMRMRPTVNLLPMLCGLRVVCLSDTTFSSTETVEPIHMLFRVQTQIGPRNHLLHADPNIPRKRVQFFETSGLLKSTGRRQQ